jgi:hypothetical protein
MRKMLAASVAAVSLVFSAPACADDYSWASNEYNYASRQLDNFISNFQDDLVDPTVQRMRRAKAADANKASTSRRQSKAPVASPTASAAPILFTPVRIPAAQSTARMMASAYPAESQAKAEALFNELLVKYAELEKMNGVPHRDLGAAVAFFLGGNWMAMNNADLPDDKFPPIVAQMRSVLSSSSQFTNLSNRQKQDIYEQMVIHGMLMATTQMALRTQKDAAIEARMRAAGKANLTQWFGTDASSLRLTASGMAL